MGVVIEPIISDRRIHDRYIGRSVDGATIPQTTKTVDAIHGHFGKEDVNSHGSSNPNIRLNAPAVVNANRLSPRRSNSGISSFIES